MIETLLLAFALSMDAFAVSLGIGTKRFSPWLMIQAALYFGFFQALMPLLGFEGGKSLLAGIAQFTHWIAFALLLIIGAKMFWEGYQNEPDNPEILEKLNHKMLLAMAVATSLDAMAAGFGLGLIDINPYTACMIIGVTTFCMSIIGVLIGKISGDWLDNKAEMLGGVVLILMAFKLLLIR